MKNGLSPTAKWMIAIIALLILAMGISGAASANRASEVVVDHRTFADTILLQHGINFISMLQGAATPAATPALQTGGADAGTCFGLDITFSGRNFVSGQDMEIGNKQHHDRMGACK